MTRATIARGAFVTALVLLALGLVEVGLRLYQDCSVDSGAR